ncbi:Pleckstrin homology domain-containing protein [Pseudomassariella vexata]|uniref:Pleckstrin homology domain-domain-containing protein n=1 Tax=Pseudomassariella vexata TaxID=1141098 RepID=A0A1Y2D8G5_9PEZI|nr:Pleckstrin homology domain-containing protein [Pseudomassariella vexata]ORY55464.1 Pleckstrin homology domain-domain-containing protein [Pseudomassariella vexata]
MADAQKPVEVPETAPTVTEAAETTPAPVESTPVATDATPAVEETKATEAPAPAEATAAETPAPAEEVKPVEEGTLEHKAAPASFPKNLIYSKQHFWFGTDAIPSEKLATYLKSEKAAETAHHVVSWAAQTGQGLLFFGKEADKTTPHGAIQLAEASEPTTEGANKFTVVSKGHKHTFKAANAADRDNWVAQLKLKIAEAKELATTVTESETYKSTLESFKPAKKEEKPVAPTTEAVVETPAATEAPKEETAAPVEEAKEEPKEEKKEEKKEEPKRRSASRKRASIFGNLLGKKEEKEVKKPEETPAAATEAPATVETPAVEPVVATEAPVEPVAATETPAVETPAAVEESKPLESPKEKPIPTKRSSIFGNLSFGRKKSEIAEAAPATPAKDTAPVTETEPVAENAPVIPQVETSEPLSTEVASPANVPTETVDATPATNGETKKEMKTDKRKSSLPFNFGKKEKSGASDEEGEKVKSPPLFSKLRQTMKGKAKADKPAEKVEDKPIEEETPAAAEAPASEAPAAAEASDATPAAEESKGPAVPATAPVTAAA